MQAFADLLQRYRVPWIAAFIALTAVGVFYAVRVKPEFQAESLLRTDDDTLRALRRYEHVFPSAEARFLVGVDLRPAYALGGEALLESLAGNLRSIDGIARVITPKDAVGGNDPTRSTSVKDLLLAEDLRTGALVVFLSGAVNTTAGRERVFQDVHRVLDDKLPRHRYAIAGSPFYRREFVRFLGEDQMLFIPLTLVMLLILLFYLFRRPLWVALPFVCVAMTLAWTLGLLGFTHRPLTMLTGALPTLLISIGVAVAIHVIYQFREELGHGGSNREVARRTVAHVGLPCLLTTLTTMVGFGSLVLARIPDIREFGALSAIGVGFSFIICIVLIPYVLAIGHRKEHGQPHGGAVGLGVVLGAICHMSAARPVTVLVVAVAVLAAAAFGAVIVDMDAYLTDDMGKSTFIYHSYKFFEERLASLIPLDVVVESDEPGGLLKPEGRAVLGKVQAFLAARPFVAKTLSALDVLDDFKRYRPFSVRMIESGSIKGMQRAMEQLNRDAPVGALTDAGGKVARVVCLLQDIGASRSFVFYDAIADFARREVPPGYRVSVAGVSVLANRVVHSIIKEGGRSFVLAVLIIFVVCALLFRSLKTGVLSLVGTLAPIFVGLGAMGILGIVIRTSTVIVGSIALGLAIDLTIHLLGRYRRERAAGRSGGEAIDTAMTHTGKPIVVTGGILVLGFATLGLSRFGLTSEFGVVAAITIATALITTLFVLPALLTLGLQWKERRTAAPGPEIETTA